MLVTTNGKVKKIGSYYYFEGIQLRGKTLLLRQRIVGVRKIRQKNQNEWILRCTKRRCPGICTYRSGHDDKNVQYEFCDACRFPENGKTYIAKIDGQNHKRVVSHASWDSYYGKPKYYVNCQECTSVYPLEWFIGPRKRLHCFACHRKYRTMFGQYVASDHVWSFRATLRPPKLYRFKRQIHIDWQINCPTTGCPEAVGLRKGKQMVCEACRVAARAMPDFHALYNAHIRQDSQRLKKNPDHKLSELTREQFIMLMDDDVCHYCKEHVQRHKRIKHTAADGRRMSASVFLDRLDSSEPYRVGNAVTCCTGCNITKNAWLTEDEMMLIAGLRRGARREAKELLKKMFEGYDYPDPRDKLLRKRSGLRPRKLKACL